MSAAPFCSLRSTTTPIVIVAGWIWGFPHIKRALTNLGALHNDAIVRSFFTVVKFVTPVLVLLVLLNGLGVF